MKRLLAFLMILIAVWSLETWWLNSLQAEISTKLALRQLGGLNADAARLRAFDAGKDAVHLLALTVTVLAALVCFGRQIKTACGKIRAHISKVTPLLIGGLCVAGLTGCIRPYDKPEFVEVDT